MIILSVGADAFAEQDFEINKKNCNLPVQKIRKIIPDKPKQEEIYQQCIKKAVQERWIQKSLVSK